MNPSTSARFGGTTPHDLLSPGFPSARHGFTLVELLVVISIIVILLALLVPALNRALEASENAKCASNQRNIAQQISGYALGQRYMLPPSVGTWTQSKVNSDSSEGDLYASAGDFAYAMDYRATQQTSTASLDYSNGTAVASAQPSSGLLSSAMGLLTLASTPGATPDTGDGGANTGLRKLLGLGILVQAGMLPTSKLGEIAHCPRMNTSSSAPTPRFGMDETYTIPDSNQSAKSSGKGAGGSYLLDPAQSDPNNPARIIGSYNYRGTSWAFARGGNAVIQYAQLTPTFPLLVDNPDVRYGRRFTHKTGYYVGYGDGSCRYFEDQLTKTGSETIEYGNVERGQTGFNGGNPTSLDGRSGYNPDQGRHMEEYNNPNPAAFDGVWVQLAVPPQKK